MSRFAVDMSFMRRLCRPDVVRRPSWTLVVAWLMVGVGGALLAEDVPLATVDPKSLAVDDIQDVWFVAPPRPPCLVRFHIRRAGVGYVSAWGEFLVEQFERLDRDGDFLLSEPEFSQGPWELVALRRQALAQRQPQPIDFLALDIAPDDNFVSLDELLAALGDNGVHTRTPIVSGGGGGEADYLFELLDADGNGKLTAAESDEAPGLLARWDTNGDEALAPSEIVLALAARRRSATLDTKAPTLPQRYILTPPARMTVDETVNELISAERLGRSQNAGTLSINTGNFVLSSRSAPPQPNDAVPTDRQGWLSLLAGRAPDVEFLVSLDAEGNPILALARAEGAPVNAAETHVAPLPNGVRVKAPDGALLNVETAKPSAFNAQQFENVFESADRDNNGYLDRREAAQYGFLRTFARMDADHNNQIFLEEFIPFQGQKHAQAQRRTDLTVTPQSSVLLVAVQEGENDGFLSAMELSSVARRVREYDRDGDGQFALDERVERYQILIGAGSGDANADIAFGLGGPVRLVGIYAGDQVTISSGAAWFIGMDANRDGLVSRREFLGKPERFADWDRDQDGVITAAETQTSPMK